MAAFPTFMILAAAGIVLATIVAHLAHRWPFGTLSAFLLLLLGHEGGIRWLRTTSGLPGWAVTGISLWKEAALAGLLLAFGIRFFRHRARIWPPHIQPADWLLGLLVLLGAAHALLSPNLLAGIAAFRDYFEPAAVFLVARVFLPGKRRLHRLLWAGLAAGGLLAALGIWQATLREADTYRPWGFGEPSGEIDIPEAWVGDAVVLRPPSTVTGPNELGLHMALLVLASLQLLLARRGTPSWLAGIFAVLYAVALVFTYSRSDFLGLVAGLLVVAAVNMRASWRKRPVSSPRPITSGLLYFSLGSPLLRGSCP